MSILIKNTTMPKNCIECPMQFGGWCYVCPPDIDERVAETVEEAVKQGKPDWCPLVEIEGDDVVPVVHGHWSKEMRFTEDFMGNRTYGYKCSICGKLANRLQFCGNCGAKMNESEDKQ